MASILADAAAVEERYVRGCRAFVAGNLDEALRHYRRATFQSFNMSCHDVSDVFRRTWPLLVQALNCLPSLSVRRWSYHHRQ